MPLVEAFSSVQGEGALVGELQHFLRLGICPFRCLYCDTEESWTAASTWRFTPGAAAPGVSLDPETRPNPVGVDQAMAVLFELDAACGETRPVSVTGGEPLVHADFLAALLPEIRDAGRPVRLETAGAHGPALARVAAASDHVSADWKCPSTMEDAADLRDAHRAFLAAAAEVGCDLCVKVVVTAETSAAEVDEAATAVAHACPDATLVIQPVTPCRLALDPLPHGRAFQLLEAAREALAAAGGDPSSARVLPQLHKTLGLP